MNEAKRHAVLTLPPRVSYAEAGDFLTRHFDWLASRLAELPEPVPFIDGACLPVRGQDHDIEVVPRARGRSKVWLEPDRDAITPLTRPRIFVHGPDEQVPARLLGWLKGEARGDIDARVRHHADFLGVRPKRLSIRDQTTRWGSCSAEGALSFSWRLILAPPFVLDYVAAHEVAHIRELNHGARFWSLVRASTPRLDEARTWLKANGPRLHQYGAEQT